MSKKAVIHSIGEAKLAPTHAALGAAQRLENLRPLKAVSELDALLSRGEVVMAQKATARQETQNIVDQLRSQSKKRRANASAKGF